MRIPDLEYHYRYPSFLFSICSHKKRSELTNFVNAQSRFGGGWWVCGDPSSDGAAWLRSVGPGAQLICHDAQSPDDLQVVTIAPEVIALGSFLAQELRQHSQLSLGFSLALCSRVIPDELSSMEKGPPPRVQRKRGAWSERRNLLGKSMMLGAT